MKKGTNKTDNYFERVKQRLHPPNTDIISSIICILRVNNGARKPSDAPVHSFYWSIG